MIESFVDVSYCDFELARRVRLADVDPAAPYSGYLELPQPMPVGTTVVINADEGISIQAKVIAIHEQIASNGAAVATVPGMKVTPDLTDPRVASWWKARRPVSTIEEATPPAPRKSAEILAQVAVESENATHHVVDDGKKTTIMDAVDPELVAKLMAEAQASSSADAGEDESSAAPPSNDANKKKPRRKKGK